MDTSVFLAKALGLYCSIIGLGMLLNPNGIKPVISDIINNRGILFLSGFVALILGILIITSHNIWALSWRVLITILGWLALIKGIIRIAIPQFASKTNQQFIENNNVYFGSALITLIIGVMLLYFGYF